MVNIYFKFKSSHIKHVQCTDGRENYRREYVLGRKPTGGNMSGWKNDGREYVLGEKTTGGNMPWVSKMTGGSSQVIFILKVGGIYQICVSYSYV